MGCCNGDCLGSVQLVQGPKGAAGDAGSTPNVELLFTATTDNLAVTTDGSGTPTVNLSDLHDYDVVNADVKYSYPASSSTYSQVFSDQVAANTVGRSADTASVRAGDILRLRFVMMGQVDREAATTERYHFKVELGTTTVVDTDTGSLIGFALGDNDKVAPSAAEYTLDFIVNSSGNADAVLRAEYGNSVYDQNSITAPNVPYHSSPTKFKFIVNQAAAFNTNQDLKLSIKNTTGSSEKSVKVVYYEIIKLHKG